MIKSELVKHIAERKPDLYPHDVKKNYWTGSLRRLRGEIGWSCVDLERSRSGIGAPAPHLTVDQKSVPYFKTGKEMRKRLNQSPL